MRLSYVHFENVGRWILSELIYEGNRGLSQKSLLQKAKMWEYDKSDVLKALRGLERDGKIINVGQNYWARKKMKQQFVAMTSDELLRVAHDLFAMSEWDMGHEVAKVAREVMTAEDRRLVSEIERLVKKFKRAMERYQLLLELHEAKYKELMRDSTRLFREQGVKRYDALDQQGQQEIDELTMDLTKIGDDKDKMDKEMAGYDKKVTDLLESAGLSDGMFMGRGFLMDYYIGGKYDWREMERDLNYLLERVNG